jgi:hypothetical protein
MQHRRRNDDGVGESAVDFGSQKSRLRAQLVMPGAAVATLATRDEWFDAHPVAGGDRDHARSYEIDDAADFVAGSHADEWEIAPKAVQVAAADTAKSNPHPCFPRYGHGRRDLVDLDRSRRTEDGSSHCSQRLD